MDYSFCSPVRFNKNHLWRKIKKINVCAYPNRNSPEYPATNHWVMFLQYSWISSVKVDMHPSRFGRGSLELSSKKYTQADRAIHTFSLEVEQRFTIGDFADFIDECRLDEYYFTREYEGCRYWIHRVIEILGGEDELQAGSAKSAWDSLSYYYADKEEPVLREIKYNKTEAWG